MKKSEQGLKLFACLILILKQGVVVKEILKCLGKEEKALAQN